MEPILAKKKVLKASITRAINDIEKSDSFTKVELQLFEKKCNKLESECSLIFDQIFTNCESKDYDKFGEEQSSIQEQIDKLWVNIKERLSVNEKDKKNDSITSESKLNDNIRLPRLNLPSFSGNVQDWLSYRDLFKASIHNSEILSNSEKLSYLKLSLQGEAAKIIQSIPITDANYQIAWELLEERYSNIKDQVFAHLKRFFSVPVMQGENPNFILKLVDAANESIRSLETLEQKIEGFSEVVLAYVLLQKLDSSTKIWFERECKKDELPKIKDLISFLKNYARTLQASKPNINFVTQKKCQKEKVTSFVSSVKHSKCVCCNDNNFHPLHKCDVFRGFPFNKKIELLRKHKICFNCLSSSTHTARNCNSRFFCIFCSKRHHSLIHYQSERVNNSPLSEREKGGSQTSCATELNSANISFGEVPVNNSLNPEAKSFESFNETQPKQSFVGTSMNESKKKTTILSTAVVYVQNELGEFIPCRILCDSGSMSNYISNDCANLLSLPKNSVNISACGLNNSLINRAVKVTTK